MNFAYINHDEVAALIKSRAVPGKDYQVVDVRGECLCLLDQIFVQCHSTLERVPSSDEDFRGGNIPGAINAPSEQRTEQTVQDLVTKLTGVPTVIFHCTLSREFRLLFLFAKTLLT